MDKADTIDRWQKTAAVESDAFFKFLAITAVRIFIWRPGRGGRSANGRWQRPDSKGSSQ